MASFNSIKNKIDNVIYKYGTTITVIPVTADVYNEDIGWTQTTSSSISTIGIPYNLIYTKFNLSPAGNNNLGRTKVIIKGDVTVTNKDTVIVNSVNYILEDIENIQLGDTTQAKILTLNQKL